MSYFNPYSDQDFFGFFAVLFQRLYSFICGNLSIADLASDELQMLVLSGVAISSALVGVFLVLRRMTMLANSLSHTILLGIILTYLMLYYDKETSPTAVSSISTSIFLFAAVLTALLTTFFTQFLTQTAKLYEDASTGLVFTSFFALGIVLVTLFTRNSHIGTEIVMGNVDLLHVQDLILPWISTCCNLLLLLLFFKEFQATSFDPTFARAIGISLPFFNYLLMTQTSVTLVGSFRSVGVLLALAFIVVPVLIAQLLTKRLGLLLTLSALIGVVASCIGIALARHILSAHGIPLSTTGLIVCVLITCYFALLCWIFLQKQFSKKKISL